MSPSKSVIQPYLSKYAEPDISLIQAVDFDKTYPHVVVIPAFDESPVFLERLAANSHLRHTLCICVINQPDTLLDESPKNRQLMHFLESRYKKELHRGHISLYRQTETDHTVLAVNRFTHGLSLPVKKGVGLARKIGCDIAAKLIETTRVSDTWIYSSDADAHLPDNYFDKTEFLVSSVNPPANHSAMVFSFNHLHCDNTVSEATAQYEKAIKYYQQGLAFAGSPYAFHTLGSTLAVDVNAYCKVRGFPTKAAGEDFYLLNKLAKVGTVSFTPGITVNIESRISERVPFGTGPKVKQIIEDSQRGKVYHYYNPKIFKQLKGFLSQAPQLFNHAINELNVTNETREALQGVNIDIFLLHAHKQCKNQKQFDKAFHDWFDAFITLKFIHFLQDKFFSSQPLEQCLTEFSHIA